MIKITFLILIILIFLNKVNGSNSNCYTIIKCDPEIATFDSYSLHSLDNNNINKEISVRCTFRGVEADNSFSWRFYMGDRERVAYDMDANVFAPFKHQLIKEIEPGTNREYSVSILTIPLLNETYFTNYTLWSITGSCFHTVRLHLSQSQCNFLFFFFTSF
jgi:hypothetical protein